MPELMMQYRAGAFFQRAYAPEISMGLMSAEELHDMGKYNRDIVDAVAEEVVETSETIDTETGEIIQPESKTKEESDF